MDTKLQYKAYKERMMIKGHEFLIVGFEEFEEALKQANEEDKNNGRNYTEAHN